MHNGAPFTGLGLAGLAVGLLAGLATGAYLAHRLGGSGRVAALVRRTRSRAGSVARELEAEAGEIDTRDLEDEDQDYAVDDILDDESGDDWDDENDEDDDDGDAYDDDDAFSSADPDLEERVLEAFTNDPILSERAVDIGADSGVDDRVDRHRVQRRGTRLRDDPHRWRTWGREGGQSLGGERTNRCEGDGACGVLRPPIARPAVGPTTGRRPRPEMPKSPARRSRRQHTSRSDAVSHRLRRSDCRCCRV